MASLTDAYLARAENELVLAKINFEISTNEKHKILFNIEQSRTFFNDVISQSYYAIFYAAKAFLLTKNIETKTPDEHKKLTMLLEDLWKVEKLIKPFLKFMKLKLLKQNHY